MDCGTASSRGLKICCRAVMAPPGVTAIAGNRLFVEAVIWGDVPLDVEKREAGVAD
jgi:hypothetical protein